MSQPIPFSSHAPCVGCGSAIEKRSWSNAGLRDWCRRSGTWASKCARAHGVPTPARNGKPTLVVPLSIGGSVVKASASLGAAELSALQGGAPIALHQAGEDLGAAMRRLEEIRAVLGAGGPVVEAITRLERVMDRVERAFGSGATEVGS